MRITGRAVKYCFAAATALTAANSFQSQKFDWNNIGLIRTGRAGLTVLKIGMKYKFDLYSSELDHSSSEFIALKSKIHKEAAEQLLELCRANKGAFIKVGQHIGALEYLVPTEYVNTMKVLHSQAPSSPLNDIYRVIKEDLNEEVDDLFTEFHPEPLGAASLAQVHKAKLKDGRTVAIKVQHPYVKGTSVIDLKIMEVLVKLVSWAFPDFQFQWLVDETKRNLPRELDFVQEKENMLKIKKMLGHIPWLKIPEVYNEYSTGRVLTMEFVEGGQVNDINYMTNHKIDPFDVSDKLGQLYCEMIFTRGFVHSDPHPGNLLVNRFPRGKAQIILLDHGLYAQLSDNVRTNYAGLWLSILDKDMVGMKKYGDALGVGKFYGLFACMVSGRSWDAIQSGLKTTHHSVNEKDIFQKEIPKVLPEIFRTLALMNRELLLILKTNDLLRGIEYTLKTQNRMSSYLVMSKFCIRSVYNNEIKLSSHKIFKLKTFVLQQWTLLKICIYYLYLSICTLSFNNFILKISS